MTAAPRPELVDRATVLCRTGPAGAERMDPWAPWDAAPPPPPDKVLHPERLQDAIDRAIAAGKTRHLHLTAGEGEGPVILPREAANLTITADKGVRITANIDAEMPGEEYRRRFAHRFATSPECVRKIFEAICARRTITTHNSGVVRIEADGVTLRGLEIENTYPCDRASAAPPGAPRDAAGRFARGQHQAVALHGAGADRLHLDRVGLISFQDTLYLQHPAPFSTARSYLSDCRIAGDVDFIFGQATAVFDGCTIVSRGARGASTWVAAPATNIATPFGFVFDGCRFVQDGRLGTGQAHLARQWFEGVRTSPYRRDLDCVPAEVSGQGTISRATLESVGKCRVQRCVIGDHVATDPWAPWNDTSSARHRPVQRDRAAMRAVLGQWLDRHDVNLPRSADPWLVELSCDRVGRLT
ncbi:hypothetical protein EU805_07215 [Salipiger sp. IMCC34102]|uniref:pectinesterase family protein n=1 Tax=Salipiger sp. IMCC34102 TaxID=2510647 RepID=UPI00101C574F|nr:pectinesterase family protein [Salipiger sp. IMCC34102]RYH03500.1 hypothetical protein EU805_07215 [Salipiger sp. IMCC34102]